MGLAIKEDKDFQDFTLAQSPGVGREYGFNN
jgi:hypothetical protein